MEHDSPFGNHARLGQGTWRMGEARRRRPAEVAALRLGLDLGLTLIDTAEMYAAGGAEAVVGEAIEGRRDDVYLVSKVLPENASYEGTLAACERSLSHLRTDRLDLYLLHWPSSHPFEETLGAFERLVAEGKILAHGVSNFDVAALEAGRALPGGENIVANQVLYNLGRRGIERKLKPWCLDRGVWIMAYSPVEQGRLTKKAALERVAGRHGVTPEQVALAWVLRHPGVVTIPKAASPRHVRQNAEALALPLTAEDLAELDRDYPPPGRDVELEIL